MEWLSARLRELSVSDLRDLVDEHTAVAAQAARLAAERISPVSARRLFALTDHLGTAQTLGDRIRADSRFHIEVAVASQSARLTRLEANLQAEVSGLVWLPIGPRSMSRPWWPSTTPSPQPSLAATPNSPGASERNTS